MEMLYLTEGNQLNWFMCLASHLSSDVKENRYK